MGAAAAAPVAPAAGTWAAPGVVPSAAKLQSVNRPPPPARPSLLLRCVLGPRYALLSRRSTRHSLRSLAAAQSGWSHSDRVADVDALVPTDEAVVPAAIHAPPPLEPPPLLATAPLSSEASGTADALPPYVMEQHARCARSRTDVSSRPVCRLRGTTGGTYRLPAGVQPWWDTGGDPDTASTAAVTVDLSQELWALARHSSFRPGAVHRLQGSSEVVSTDPRPRAAAVCGWVSFACGRRTRGGCATHFAGPVDPVAAWHRYRRCQGAHTVSACLPGHG